MTQTILVAMDYSELSKEALRTTVSLHPDASVVVLHVLDWHASDTGPGGWGSTPHDWDDWLQEANEHADELFDEAREIAAEYDVEITTDTVVGEDARSVVSYAEEHDVDLVVVGSHGRSIPARILLGSVAETVARRAPVPVLIVR